MSFLRNLFRKKQPAPGKQAGKLPPAPSEASPPDPGSQSFYLERLKNSTEYPDTFYAVLDKVTDQAGLATFVKSLDNQFYAEAIVERITDLALLKDVAFNASEYHACMFALNKIDDQAFFADAAERHPFHIVRCYAIQKLTDRNLAEALLAADAPNQKRVLKKLLEDPESDEFSDLLDSLLDQSLLAELARSIDRGGYAEVILARIDRPDLVSDIARHAVNANIRQRASDRVDDQESLLDIAKNHPDFRARKKAIRRLKDRDLADDLVKAGRTKGPETGWMVTERWTDWSVAAPGMSKYRDEIQTAIDALASDQIVRGDLPAGAFVVFGRRENSETIADMLKSIGCPQVNVERVQLEYSDDEADDKGGITPLGLQDHCDVRVTRIT